MVREMITVQVGQCGNQLGRLFWDSALAEHAEHNEEGVYDEVTKGLNAAFHVP